MDSKGGSGATKKYYGPGGHMPRRTEAFNASTNANAGKKQGGGQSKSCEGVTPYLPPSKRPKPKV